MRYFFLLFGLAVISVMFIAGKRGETSRKPPIYIFPDMDRQGKLRPQKEFGFFADQRSSRLPVDGTVARDQPWEDIPVNTGKQPGTTNFVENIPVPLTEKLLARGQDRYSINCLPCHGPLGDGKGITSKFGMNVLASLHDPRIVAQADGEIFNTITHGKNLMGAYAGQIDIDDRWAIIAYVRALQRSRVGSVEDVPIAQRAQFGN